MLYVRQIKVETERVLFFIIVRCRTGFSWIVAPLDSKKKIGCSVAHNIYPAESSGFAGLAFLSAKRILVVFDQYSA